MMILILKIILVIELCKQFLTKFFKVWSELDSKIPYQPSIPLKKLPLKMQGVE